MFTFTAYDTAKHTINEPVFTIQADTLVEAKEAYSEVMGAGGSDALQWTAGGDKTPTAADIIAGGRKRRESDQKTADDEARAVAKAKAAAAEDEERPAARRSR